MMYFWRRSSSKIAKNSIFREFHEGMKPKTLSLLSMPINHFRKLILVCWVICYSPDNWNIESKISFLSFLQIIYLIYMAKVRPFNKISDNIVMMINEAVFTF